MEKLIKAMILTSIILSGLALAGCSSTQTPTPVQPVQVNSLAPDFQLESLDGETVSLRGLRGRPVMLNFWATWCGPCQAEMPAIQEVFEDEEWAEQELVILAVNLGESPSEVKQFMEERGLSFPVLLDTDMSVGENYNIRGIPTTFFVDKNGIIKDSKIGAFSSKAEIDWRLINSILDGE